MSIHHAGSYAGDISASDAFSQLAAVPGAILVDVRTRPEWAFVGTPDLTKFGKTPVFVEWQEYPDMNINPDFLGRLREVLTAQGADAQTPIFFLCRSGVRSRSAAIAMTEAGQQRCYNVAGGFEGPHDASGKRGAVSGWKASDLPWAQP